jgi:hypothetical protein
MESVLARTEGRHSVVSAPWDRLGHHLAYGGSPLLLRQERLMPNLDFCCAMFALVVLLITHLGESDTPEA